MTNVVLLIYTTTLVVALPMKEESLKEFHCKNSPDYNQDSYQKQTKINKRDKKIITDIVLFHFSAGWRKYGADPFAVKNFESNNDNWMGFTYD